jgi:hypothetical protein
MWNHTFLFIWTKYQFLLTNAYYSLLIHLNLIWRKGVLDLVCSRRCDPLKKPGLKLISFPVTVAAAK